MLLVMIYNLQHVHYMLYFFSFCKIYAFIFTLFMKTPVICVEDLNPEQLEHLFSIEDNPNPNRTNIVAFSIHHSQRVVYLIGELTTIIDGTEYYCKSYDEFINFYQCLKLELML